MDSIKKMDTINVTALPMIAVDERMVISVNVRKALQSVLRKQLRDHPPTCIVGSLSEVNKKITEIDLGPSMLASTSAIEEYELEKMSLKEKTHGSLGDRVKRPKEESPCKGSELRNAKLIMTKRKTAEKNLLAELYQHPEFDETKPTKLPNGVDFCDMVGNVIRSEKNPLSGKSYCSDRELEKFLSSPFFSAMWLDSFWWIFHERYQPKKEIQNKLFDRIALNYAFLLFKTVRSHYVEALIKRLPSLLSKALYTSFCCCFPQSWFNTHEFKSAICDTMELWVSGTYPCPQSYDSWDYSELDPERFRREEMLQSSRLIRGREFSLFTCKKNSIQKVEQNKHKKFLPSQVSGEHRPDPSTPQSPETATTVGFLEYLSTSVEGTSCPVVPHFLKNGLLGLRLCTYERNMATATGSSSLYASQERDFSRGLTSEESTGYQHTMKDQPSSTLSSRKASQQVKRISEARACMSFCLKKSHPACKIPKMTLNKFNIYGNSPLLVYFFLNYSRLRPHGQDVLMNRSEKTKLIPDSVMTYADIICQVKKNMDTRRKKLRQLSQLHESEWTYFNSYLTELQENYMREVKIINKKVAEKRKANNVFLSPSILFDDLFDKKSRGNPHNEMAFLSRKKIKDVEERQKILSSSSSFQRPVDNYSLGLKSPYRIGSISSEAIASMTKVTQDMLFRLSPSIE
ncbi:protein FAM227A isoform X3 [Cricetulus griseus]|uniref:Protein FAM227A isoform X3 n=2 Tax=Cricetulus griseus TaxID=10029 RepID=A0A9J7FJV9_CRIGR|nr:protein FAM227A isoform X3 [Cricetulus griseus]